MWKETLVAIITVLMLAIVTAMIILAFTLDANATDYHTVVQQQVNKACRDLIPSPDTAD